MQNLHPAVLTFARVLLTPRPNDDEICETLSGNVCLRNAEVPMVELESVPATAPTG